MLHDLPRRFVREVAWVADEVALPAGTVLVRQGGRAGAVYLVGSGFLDVSVDGRDVALVRPGEVVGERGVLGGGRRTATVVAATDVTVFEIPARLFTPLLARSHDLEERMRRPAA